ncbi:methyltransferase [Streptomyces sp. MK37H]|nr:methyltransferase [Streptomyces sp. MK37H]
MPSTLHTEPVATVLDGLLEAEREGDERAFAETGVTDPKSAWAELDASQMAETFKDASMSVSKEGGELLYLLTRATGARTVVEYGTSFGVSTLYLASAVRDNGGGQVIGTELQADKVAKATEAIAAAGLSDIATVRVGDARETLRDLPGSVDLLLMDGWPNLNRAVLKVVEPRLRRGALVLVDDMDMDFGFDMHREMREYLADPASGYLSLPLPVAHGILAGVRLGQHPGAATVPAGRTGVSGLMTALSPRGTPRARSYGSGRIRTRRSPRTPAPRPAASRPGRRWASGRPDRGG